MCANVSVLRSNGKTADVYGAHVDAAFDSPFGRVFTLAASRNASRTNMANGVN